MLSMAFGSTAWGQAVGPAIATGQGVCNAGPVNAVLQAANASQSKSVVRFSVDRATLLSLAGIDMLRLDGPSTFWGLSTAATTLGTTPTVGYFVQCNDPVAWTAELYPIPSVPASYSGVAVAGSEALGERREFGSDLYFKTPIDGDYAVDVAVSQGSVQVDGTTVATRGQITRTVASEADGLGVSLVALPGPPADWSASARLVPVTVSAAAKPSAARQGTPIRVRYSVSGGAFLTAGVLDGAGNERRSLAAAFRVRKGESSLTLDGLDPSGEPLPDGSYQIRLTFDQPTIGPSIATTTVKLDSSPPRIRVVTPRVISRTRGVVVEVSDAVVGVKSARLFVDGVRVRGGTHAGRLVYRPAGGWERGSHHTLRVQAADKLNNRREFARRFRVKRR